ncbi:hypothetical protein HAX54_051964 [Datura stramonium]|uniref:Uncharacterized protein n=1 Tax=Datura stramonium TaxID=4076 RepID=A0ABS8SYD1_DATST|nr:hypothetical protein [Datura stramonium]
MSALWFVEVRGRMRSVLCQSGRNSTQHAEQCMCMRWPSVPILSRLRPTRRAMVNVVSRRAGETQEILSRARRGAHLTLQKYLEGVVKHHRVFNFFDQSTCQGVMPPPPLATFNALIGEIHQMKFRSTFNMKKVSKKQFMCYQPSFSLVMDSYSAAIEAFSEYRH